MRRLLTAAIAAVLLLCASSVAAPVRGAGQLSYGAVDGALEEVRLDAEPARSSRRAPRRGSRCNPPIAWSKLDTSQAAAAATIRDVWPDHLEGRALQIAWRESRFRPAAKNPKSSATGLMQVLAKTHGPRARSLGYWPLTDARNNALMGLDLYRRAGWAPWRCR